MSNPALTQGPYPRLTSCYRSGGAMLSRSVSDRVLSASLDLPAPPKRLIADWQRDVTQHLVMDIGDVEELPLARARTRWPDYRRCTQMLAAWLAPWGLADVMAEADVALMACCGTRYHHDAAQYGSAVFCNLFISEGCGLDLHFPQAQQRIALERGTVVVFDTAQPHAVIPNRSSAFVASEFPPVQDCIQVFLTWELPVADPRVAQALGIGLEGEKYTALPTEEEQVWCDGAPLCVCPDCGRWQIDTQSPCLCKLPKIPKDKDGQDPP